MAAITTIMLCYYNFKEKVIKIDSNLKKNIINLGDIISLDIDGTSKHRIKKADFDKTYVGWVAAKRYVDPEKTGADDDFRWCIQTDGAEYEIKPEMSNITAIGQRVRLYVPNHEYKNKYAEVIATADNGKLDGIPDKVVKVSDNEIHAYYGNIRQIWTAEGKGNERYNFKEKTEVIEEDKNDS